MADNDSQVDLKKRARRRLVGSAALALAAVIVLPMVMDHEPRLPSQDVQIRIPSQEGGNFTSRVITGKAPAPSQPVAGTVAEEAVVPEVDDSAHHKDEAESPSPMLKPGQELLPPKVLRKSDVVKADVKSEPKKPDPKPEPKKIEPKPEPKKVEAKPEPKKPEPKAEPKPDPKVKEREKEREREKEKAQAQAEADKQRAAEAERAKALLSGGAPKDGGAGNSHVVMLGAYREAANVTSLRAKLKAEGYASYVEPLGDKIRVRAGPFANKAAADKAAARISKILGVPASVAAKP